MTYIQNVGTGVRDFFYEPINGIIQGPAEFLEGLETGTKNLARGLFVGVVRGAANVTEVSMFIDFKFIYRNKFA